MPTSVLIEDYEKQAGRQAMERTRATAEAVLSLKAYSGWTCNETGFLHHLCVVCIKQIKHWSKRYWELIVAP